MRVSWCTRLIRQPTGLVWPGALIGRFLSRGHSACGRFRMVTDKDLYVRTISDVIDYYGENQVAVTLDVSLDDVQRWLAGTTRPPTDTFFRIIELKSKVKA